MKGNNWNSRTMNWITGFTKMRGYKYFVSDFERIHEVTPEFSEEIQAFRSLRTFYSLFHGFKLNSCGCNRLEIALFRELPIPLPNFLIFMAIFQCKLSE